MAVPLESEDAKKPDFTPKVLDRTIIAVPLLEMFKREDRLLNQKAENLGEDELADLRREFPKTPHLYPVVIDLNLEYHQGRFSAREEVFKIFREIKKNEGAENFYPEDIAPQTQSPQYVYGDLTKETIKELVRRVAQQADQEKSERKDVPRSSCRAIYHIWPDFEVHRL